MGSIIGNGSSSSRRNQAAWRMWREKKAEKKKEKKKGKQKIPNKPKQKEKKNKRTEMRTQERKPYDENGKYIHTHMKRNWNRDEMEGA